MSPRGGILMKRLLVTLAALLLAATLASCGVADAEGSDVDCGSVEDVAQMTAEKEEELKDAQQDAKDAEGTPAESEVSERVSNLEDEIVQLGNCGEASAETTTSTVPADCPSTTWARVDSNKAGNRWFANGVPAIASASTPEEARAAAHEWANGVRTDPTLLAGAGRYMLDKDVESGELFDANGCATQVAIDLVAEMEAALALSQITPAEAPSNGYNSGTNGDTVTGAANSGISGDRRSIMVEGPNGTKIWIMARCGNPVTEGKPSVPVGPTDENPTNPPPGGHTPTTVPNGRKSNVVTTIAPPPTTAPGRVTTTTMWTPPTAPPDTVPGGVTPTTVNSVPPDRPDSGDGATNTTRPPATVAPPTQATLPPGGGTTPSP